MSKLHVKQGDTVQLLSGKNKGKRGKVLAASPKEGKIIVEGVNIVKKHVKPRKMGEQGGIIEVEGAFYAAKAQLVCPKCDKPTRIGHSFVEGKKVRVCKKCGATI
jgi:large subunit ribosomal protein L24